MEWEGRIDIAPESSETLRLPGPAALASDTDPPIRAP